MSSVKIFNYSLMALLIIVLMLDIGNNPAIRIIFWLILIGLIIFSLRSNKRPPIESPRYGYGNGFIGGGSGGFGGGFSGGRFI